MESGVKNVNICSCGRGCRKLGEQRVPLPWERSCPSHSCPGSGLRGEAGTQLSSAVLSRRFCRSALPCMLVSAAPGPALLSGLVALIFFQGHLCPTPPCWLLLSSPGPSPLSSPLYFAHRVWRTAIYSKESLCQSSQLRNKSNLESWKNAQGPLA